MTPIPAPPALHNPAKQSSLPGSQPVLLTRAAARHASRHTPGTSHSRHIPGTQPQAHPSHTSTNGTAGRHGGETLAGGIRKAAGRKTPKHSATMREQQLLLCCCCWCCNQSPPTAGATQQQPPMTAFYKGNKPAKRHTRAIRAHVSLAPGHHTRQHCSPQHHTCNLLTQHMCPWHQVRTSTVHCCCCP